MQLAILGTDADIVRLARAAVSHGHTIKWVGDVRPTDASALRQLAVHVSDWADEWELVLDRAFADAVLVGRGAASGEVRSEQLKRLATEAVSVLVVHPVVDSVLTYYELDMIRRETGAILRHYNPMALHSVLADMAGWMREGHSVAGPIHQLTCDRRLDDAARAGVLGQLARDVELIAAVAGDIRRVTAIGPSADDASFASLQVQMTTDRAASVRWSVGSRSAHGNAVETTLVGEYGAVTLHARDAATNDFPAWRLTTTADGQRDDQPLEPYDAPQIAIEQLAAAITETKTLSDSDEAAASAPVAASTWDVATRAMEVVDAVTLSLEKGRTIDVFQQQLTERLAFRGAMAALGCGLLVVSFVVIVLVTLLGGAEGAGGRRLVPSWPLMLLGVLACFLLLQAVPVLASKTKKHRKA